jgi:hypothetical protein
MVAGTYFIEKSSSQSIISCQELLSQLTQANGSTWADHRPEEKEQCKIKQ